MIAEKDAAAVTDLARLIARHGSEEILRLASMMRDPTQAGEIAELLESVAKADTVKKRNRANSKDPSRVGMGLLKQLRKESPDTHALVADIRLRLLSGNSLPTMQDVRSFAFSHGLDIGKASSRNAAVAPLLKSLSKLPLEELRGIVKELADYVPDDRSLESWWNVIVRPKTVDTRTQ